MSQQANTSVHSHGSVLLAEDKSASTVLHEVLQVPLALHGADFADAQLPTHINQFRKAYAQLLPQYEAARLASAQRGDIATQIVDALRAQLVWQQADVSQPLNEALQQTAQPLPLEEASFSGSGGWQPSVVYQGERWGPQQLPNLGSLLVQRGVVTQAAGEALSWVSTGLVEQGAIHLRGRKIAVLGGGAEMAPTRLWLAAGAEVLWLDTAAPPAEWHKDADLCGRLYWPRDNVDLLSQPREVLATLLAFADGQALDVALYAYAPGQARELRLTGVMNALVEALPSELLASVTLLVSPTTPTALSATDLQAMRQRLQQRPAWEALLAGLGLLGRGGGAATAQSGATEQSKITAQAAATRTVVGIQGASYQAAQYVAKVLVAECWSNRGDFRVSANTAAITRTRSLAHPVFTAAFGGAGAFGIETLTPRQSRAVNGLLALHDWLHPQAPVPGAVRVHGGIHTLPYPLDKALRVAAAFGFARSPRLLRGLLKG